MGRPSQATTRRLLIGGIVLGIGLAGTLDEVILHQLLDWHHFVDRPEAGGAMPPAARELGLLSDGVFHLASTVLVALGLTMLLAQGGAALQGRSARALGAVLLGAGGFNLYDAVVQHKLLGLHQVRRGVDNLLPYDLAFGGVALLLVVAGTILIRRPETSRRPVPKVSDRTRY